jgi:hypothetical protein
VGTRPTECSKKDSERQWLDCGIPCPAPFEMATSDLTPVAVVILVFMGLFTAGGVMTYRFVDGDMTDYFVAGRTLPLAIVTFTLASQSFDASAALGNAELGYKYHWWDGAVLPLGLGLSLVINGCFYSAAHQLHLGGGGHDHTLRPHREPLRRLRRDPGVGRHADLVPLLSGPAGAFKRTQRFPR